MKEKKNIGMAVIAYLLFFVPLLTDAKNDPFVKFHTKQGILLFICYAGVYVAGSIIPPLHILDIALFILLVICIINAARGQEKILPIIGEYEKEIKI